MWTVIQPFFSMAFSSSRATPFGQYLRERREKGWS
jgi:hypothetical protein